MKHDVFKIELDYIKDEKIRNSCAKILDLLPNYFYVIPASSTGKYHPDFSLGNGGLVRHVKVATRLMKELLDNPCYTKNYTNEEKDLMLMSIIIHDGLKDGVEDFDYEKEKKYLDQKNKLWEEKNKLIEEEANLDEINQKIRDVNKKIHFTAFNHPILIKNFVIQNQSELELTEEQVNFVAECVASHMGGFPWNTEYKYGTDEILYELPVPKTKYQVLVHTVDFLSSRRFLNVNFVDDDISEREKNS